MKGSITTVEKTNEIKLLLNHPGYKNITIIVVEGESDLRFFQSVLSPDTTDIHFYNGKRNLLSVVSNFPNVNTVVGLCDADFDHILGITYQNNIVTSDLHDLEMMMLTAPSVLDTLVSEYAKPDTRVEIIKNIFKNVLSIGIEIGRLRLINEREKFSLKFSALSFRDLLIVEDSPFRLILNIEYTLEQLFQRSPEAKCTRVDFTQHLESLDVTGIDAYQICSGHDITNILSIVFQDARFTNEQVSQKRIEQQLRIAYLAIGHFSGTRMIEKIRALNPNVLAQAALAI